MSSPSSELKRLEWRNTIVRAGAGAGKTTRLVEQVFNVAGEYLTKEQRPPRLLVTTFTKKATQELRERLVKKACEEHPELLEFVSSASLLHISTIHGVLVLFLRRYGHLAGIDTGFKILDGAAAIQMQKKIFKEFLLKREEYASLLETFSVDDIIRAVSDIDEFSRVASRAAPYTDKELHQALVGYQKRICNEGIQIFEQIESESESDKWCEAAASALQFLRNTLKEERSLQETLSRWEQLSSTRPKYSQKAFSRDLNEALKKWEGHFEKCAANPAFDMGQISKATETLELFERLSREMGKTFSDRKKSLGLFEMKDLEFFSLEILRKEPSLGSAFARDWDYTLIDEYQDTSPLQVEILKKLLNEVPLYVVGDPQQSIYLFRGARSEVFAEAEKTITAEDAGDLDFLKKNYRSVPELLAMINDMALQLGKEFSAMEPRDDKYDSTKSVAVFAPVQEKSEKLLPIAKFIREEGGRFDDFAVLARRNFDLIEVAQFLESQGIPTHVHSAGGFTEQREVLDVLFVLRFLANPHDYENLIGLLRTPWFKVTDTEIAAWASQLAQRDWLNLCAVAGQHPVILKLQKLLVDSVELGVFETLRRVVAESGMIEFSGYHDITGRRESNIWKLLMSLRKAERSPNFNFNAFVRQALDGFASDEEGDSEAVAALEPKRVNLMTVHKAKGLKFNKVIIPNMQAAPRTQANRSHEKLVVCDEVTQKWSLRMPLGEEDERTHLIPARETLEKFAEREKAETKRLLYVAVTRAVEKCFFTWHGEPEAGSWASMLRFDLVPGMHNEKLYSYQVWEAPWTVPAAMDAQKQSLQVREPWSNLTKENNRERISVSALLDLHVEKVVSKNSEKTIESAEKLERSLRTPYLGTKIHSYLERLRYHPDLEIDGNIHGLKEGVEYVQSLKIPPMKELLNSGEVEWGFQTKTARGVLEGQVDLWGIADGCIWVIDYKSGSEFFKERAFKQLELYAYAISRGGYQLPVKLAVVYPLSKKIEIRDGRCAAEIASEFGL